jgi:alkylation response protein AidB-like acyl-CoA dehydrogenase
MQLSYTAEYLSFQREVRQFLQTEWTCLTQSGMAGETAAVAQFRAKATGQGYLYRQYPRKYGGSEQPADVLRSLIIVEEFAKLSAPGEVSGIGLMMLAPVLLECGTEWQKEMFIPRTLTGEYRWAQGYSEPGAGSDLASLKSRAELVGDQWLINGHKIWTTRAHEATHMFALLRTEPQALKHAGLSYILLDLRQPGVTVRPIRQINDGREFCEVFLDDVRTPADWIVGARGEGWSISRVNLKHERASIGSTGRSQPAFESLLRLAKKAAHHGRPAIKDPLIRGRVAAIEGYLEAQRWSGYYQLTLGLRGESAGVLGYVNKITTTNINQEIAAVATEIIGDRGLLASTSCTGRGPERWNNQILGSLALSIAGGTSNIQRNIIAERGLGLPRDSAET